MKQLKWKSGAMVVAGLVGLVGLQASLTACSVKVGSGEGTSLSLEDQPEASEPTQLEGTWNGPCESLPGGSSASTQLVFAGSRFDTFRIAYSDESCAVETHRMAKDASFVLGDEKQDGSGTRPIVVASNQGLKTSLVLRKNERLYLADDVTGEIDTGIAYIQQNEETGAGVVRKECQSFAATYALNDDLFTVSQEGCERLAIDATANPFTGRPARSERYRLDGIERSQARSDTYVRAFFKGEQLVVEQRTGVEVKRDSYSLTSQPCGRAAGSTLFLEKKTEKDGAAPACFRWAKL